MCPIVPNRGNPMVMSRLSSSMGRSQHPAGRPGPGMNRRQVGRNAGNDRARTDLGDIRHVKLEARRGARSRGTGRVEQARVVREGGDHDRAACTYFARETSWTRNYDEKLW